MKSDKPVSYLEGAGGIGGLLAASKQTGTSIDLGYLYDGNGNVTQLFDLSDGSEEGHYEYDPFGKEIAASGNQYEWNISVQHQIP